MNEVATLEAAKEIGTEVVETIGMTNDGNSRGDRTMCPEITSSDGEQNRHDEHWPFRIKEVGRRRDDSDESQSVESQKRGSSSTELGRHGISGSRRSIEDLRAKFGEELRAQQAMFLNTRAELEARQEETLVNAWAVFENSMANLRSLIDETRPNGNGIEESKPSFNAVENWKWPSVNGLLDVASVPISYAVSKLGGHGMNAGITPSIYLTQADGVNLLYLNRTPINYSPELFSPIESAYYTAPNTCVPVSVQCQTEAIPSLVHYRPDNEADQTPSFDKNEADSGYGRMTGSGFSPCNSRQKHEELGDERISASRPSPKSTSNDKKDSASQALLKDDKKVLVFATSSEESDVPN